MRSRKLEEKRPTLAPITSTLTMPSSAGGAKTARRNASLAGPGLDPGRAERLGHRVGFGGLAGVVQPARFNYASKTGGRISDFVINTDSAGVIKLQSLSNPKVKGSLTYRHTKETTVLKVVQAYPQGDGLGAVLLFHLAKIAANEGSKVIEIAAPALTEIGFYLNLGATFTKNDMTEATQDRLVNDNEERDNAWTTLVGDDAQKTWDSGAYFEGKTDKQFSQLPNDQKENVKEATAYKLSGKKKDLVDSYLANRGAYMTSSDGLIFRDIGEMMDRAWSSMDKRWKLED